VILNFIKRFPVAFVLLMTLAAGVTTLISSVVLEWLQHDGDPWRVVSSWQTQVAVLSAMVGVLVGVGALARHRSD
jgi:hypothetical protein